ncbi:MAG: hypothetical protein ACPG5T_01150, partial [Endozoicomonas sp.]
SGESRVSSSLKPLFLPLGPFPEQAFSIISVQHQAPLSVLPQSVIASVRYCLSQLLLQVVELCTVCFVNGPEPLFHGRFFMDASAMALSILRFLAVSLRVGLLFFPAGVTALGSVAGLWGDSKAASLA